MIEKNLKSDKSLCVCLECKNTIDLSRYPSLAVGMVIECNHCGMTLLIKNMIDGNVSLQIVDEGK